MMISYQDMLSKKNKMDCTDIKNEREKVTTEINTVLKQLDKDYSGALEGL